MVLVYIEQLFFFQRNIHHFVSRTADGLSDFQVANYSDIEQLLGQGTLNRSVPFLFRT